jgi:hypothetical protein
MQRFYNNIEICLDLDSMFDGETDLQENLIILADSLAIRTKNFGIKLSNEGLKYAIVCFVVLFFEVVVEGVDEIEQKVVGIMLFVAFKLNYSNITGVRL